MLALGLVPGEGRGPYLGGSYNCDRSRPSPGSRLHAPAETGARNAAARQQLRRGVRRLPLGPAGALQYRRRRAATGTPTASGRLALIYEAPDGTVERFTFDDLKRLSNRCANALAGLGIGRGDRVGILLPQRPETAIAHLAIYKLGAVAVPLFVQFGPDALEHRLADSGARALITDGENLAKVPAGLPDLATILVVDGDSGGHPLFWPTLERARDDFAPADTGRDDPALIIYTSGTTGKPKGALHAHRVLLGHLPGVQLPHDFFPQPGDLYWTPADWAWIGGLLDVLLPSLYFGVPVLAHRARKFDPEEAFALMGRHGVRNAFLPPTALKMMRPVPSPRRRFGLDLRSVASGGEALGEDILGWSREALGVAVNEFYGQTEANLLVGNCASLFPVRPGSMGRPIPGHRVAVVSRRRRAGAGRRDRHHRGAAARPGDVPRLLEQSRGDGGEIRRRLVPDRRRRGPG